MKLIIDIPENATNGDILMNIFPTTQIRKNGNFMSFTLDGIVGTTVEDKWWDTPYNVDKIFMKGQELKYDKGRSN